MRRFVSFQSTQSMKYQLICFTDASKLAYAGLVYLRITDGYHSQSNLIISKARLTPKKTKSLPRLELLAVLIGCRLLQFTKSQLDVPIERLRLYTDSQCVLHWITSEKRLSTFVANRVKEIRQCDASFHYINTKENPADIASRGQIAEKLQSCSLWWHGPDWLLRPEAEWPEWQM